MSIVGQLRPHLPQTTPNLAPILNAFNVSNNKKKAPGLLFSYLFLLFLFFLVLRFFPSHHPFPIGSSHEKMKK
jgi:hypothetical protein